VVVIVGFALGFETVVLLRPVAGLHTNVLPPLALSDVLLPIQIAVEVPAFATGLGLTVTVTLAVLEQVPLDTVTV
jgi:hypothetical protein